MQGIYAVFDQTKRASKMYKIESFYKLKNKKNKKRLRVFI